MATELVLWNYFNESAWIFLLFKNATIKSYHPSSLNNVQNPPPLFMFYYWLSALLKIYFDIIHFLHWLYLYTSMFLTITVHVSLIDGTCLSFFFLFSVTVFELWSPPVVVWIRKAHDLNTWFPLGRSVWEVLRDMDSLEEACHWGWALWFQRPRPFPFSYLCHVLVDQEVSSQQLPQCLPSYCLVHALWCSCTPTL